MPGNLQFRIAKHESNHVHQKCEFFYTFFALTVTLLSRLPDFSRTKLILFVFHITLYDTFSQI